MSTKSWSRFPHPMDLRIFSASSSQQACTLDIFGPELMLAQANDPSMTAGSRSGEGWTRDCQTMENRVLKSSICAGQTRSMIFYS